MKKIFTYLALAFAATVGMTSCNPEPVIDNPVKEDPETRDVVIAATIESVTKVITDADGFVWKEADAEKLGIVASGTVAKSKSVTIDGKTASFTATVPFKATSIAAFYPYAEGAKTSSFDFTVPASFTPAVAGELSGDAVPMVSAKAAELAAETDEVADNVSLAMKPVLAVLKLQVYSSNAKYQAEKIESITLNANSAINGTVAINITKGEATLKGEGGQSAVVTPAAPLALTGTSSKETASKGLYMTLLPATSAGYKYTVETDVATYIFSSENDIKFTAGTIHATALDLANATKRVDTNLPKLSYESAIASPVKIETAGGTVDAGTFTASIDGKAATDYTAAYYTGVSFTGASSWLTVEIADGNHISLTATENKTSDKRSCEITAIFETEDYNYTADYVLKFTVEQLGVAKTLTYEGSIEEKRAVDSGASTAAIGLGYWYATVTDENGKVTKEHSTNPEFYDNCTFEIVDKDNNPVTWLKCVYRDNDTWWDITYEANTSEEPRTAYITGYFADVEGYTLTNPVKVGTAVTQKGVSTSGVPEITYEGNIAGPYTYGGAEQNWLDIGWWYAMVSYGGVTTKHESFPADEKYYSADNTTCIITDEAGNPVDWIEWRMQASTCHWAIRLDENATPDTRKAIVTVTYNIPEHTCTNPVKSITVIQKSNQAVKELKYEGGLAQQYNIPYTAGTNALSYWYATVDGRTMEHFAFPEYYDNCTFTITDAANKEGNTVDWCTCVYRTNDTWWDITVTENPYNVARTCYIVADFADIEGHVTVNPQKSTVIVQAANPNGTNPE